MMLVNVARALPHTWANGPGVRAAVWVQGCGRHCPGCHNPALSAPVLRDVVTVDALARWVLAQPARGLALSGGEPFEQAVALAELCRAVRAAGRDVVAFSGFTREEIEADATPGARALLAEVDLLVDGPYVAAAACDEPLRGSRNQRLHFLSGRISAHELTDVPRRELILAEGTGIATGFDLHLVEEMLRC